MLQQGKENILEGWLCVLSEEVYRKSKSEPQTRVVDLCTAHPEKIPIHPQNETGNNLILQLVCKLCSIIANLIFYITSVLLLRSKGWHASYSVISLCSPLYPFLQSLGISRKEMVRVGKEPCQKDNGKAKCNGLIFSS